jgi:type II secretory pathway component PulK
VNTSSLIVSVQKETKGAALLTVLIAMMIISIVLLEFQYTAMVERKLAYNDLNQLQAYYLAKAGIRVGLLRVTLYGRARQMQSSMSKSAGGANVGPALEAIWNLPLPAFPPDKSIVTKMVKNDRDSAEKVLQETRINEGHYTHVITSESSKINLNMLLIQTSNANSNSSPQRPNCTGQPSNPAEYVCSSLVNLLDNFLKESDDPYQEYGNLKPEELVYDIMDWVNPGNTRLNGGAKDSYYEGLNPPYKCKGNKFYTVDELKMVKGIDDHLFNKLKPYVTVYADDGKININTATSDLYKALYKDFTDDDVKKLLEERDRLGGWPSEQAFIDYAANSLNRSGIKNMFQTPTQYLTVASQSFLIDSLGMIEKSKSTVQKSIRVAVALTSKKQEAGKPCPSTNPHLDQASCAADQTCFWNPSMAQLGATACLTRPSDQNGCEGGAAGSWNASQNCCLLSSGQCVPPPGGTSTAQYPQGAPNQGQPQQQQQQVPPNAVSILYWSET